MLYGGQSLMVRLTARFKGNTGIRRWQFVSCPDANHAGADR